MCADPDTRMNRHIRPQQYTTKLTPLMLRHDIRKTSCNQTGPSGMCNRGNNQSTIPLLDQKILDRRPHDEPHGYTRMDMHAQHPQNTSNPTHDTRKRHSRCVQLSRARQTGQHSQTLQVPQPPGSSNRGHQQEPNNFHGLRGQTRGSSTLYFRATTGVPTLTNPVCHIRGSPEHRKTTPQDNSQAFK